MRFIFLCGLAALTSACVVIPEYQPTTDTPTTQLNLTAVGTAWMCSDGHQYQLTPDGNGRVNIPTGSRITIGKNYVARDYNVTHSCYTAVSFIPESGVSYYGNFELIAEHCVIQAYQEGAPTRVGLAFIPTLGPPSYCKK